MTKHRGPIGRRQIDDEIRLSDEHGAAALLDRRDVLKLAGVALVARAGASRSAFAEPTARAASPDPPGPPADQTDGMPGIFPKPQEVQLAEGRFALNEDVALIVPLPATANDLFLARFLTAELSDRYGLRLRTKPAAQLPSSGPFILMGAAGNPLVREYCARGRLDLSAEKPGPEGYVLEVSERAVMIGGSDERGAFYGLQSLRQMIHPGDGGAEVRAARIRDWPDKPFRGIKVYVPGRANVPFFRRFLRDFAALYKYNTIVIELNACMRLDRHPEVNAGWIEFTRDTNYGRLNYPPGAFHNREQNSSHQDCGDSRYLEKEEVAGIARWAEENYLEVIPEIPSLTHAFYLLARHKDLSEVPGDKWPDTYCSSNPKSYELLFDVMDEYIEVLKPRMIHTGHDEWFAPFGLCPRCKDQDPGELYGRDLVRIHDYLADRGIRMAIWGDYLLERVRGKGLRRHVAPDGWVYSSPGAMTPEQVRKLVPKDILIFNWFWSREESGKLNEAQLEEFGFRQIYGNMEPDVPDYLERSKRSTLLGGAPSSWAATSEFNTGKDMLYSILGCAGLLWSKDARPRERLSSLTQGLMPRTRRALSGEIPASHTDAVSPVDISASFNMGLAEPALDVDLQGVIQGRVSAGRKVFDLSDPGRSGQAAVIAGTEGQPSNPLPREINGIKIGLDATSLIFLHACALPATNKEAYRLIWDSMDSADLLGWYEVVYEDGLVEVVPIRYGVNILEWNWGRNRHAGRYCYGADLVVCGGANESPITFFALEWTSPRLGKVIREVRLKGSTRFRGAVPGFENGFGKVIPPNAVMLKALSVVRSRA